MENRVLSIKPEEIIEKKQASIPDQVFEAVNEMIVKKWNGSDSTFRQEDLVALILEKFSESDLEQNRRKLFDNHWLDFEDVYRKAGWKVVYDKSAYNESYPATFAFSRRKKTDDD